MRQGGVDLWNVWSWSKDSLESYWTFHAAMQTVIDL